MTEKELLEKCEDVLNKVFDYRVKTTRNHTHAFNIELFEEVTKAEFPANEVQELAVEIHEHLAGTSPVSAMVKTLKQINNVFMRN